MEDVFVVKCFETVRHLYQSIPDLALQEFCSFVLVIVDLLLEVTSLSKLHHNAKCARSLIKEGIFVGDHIFVAIDSLQNQQRWIIYLLDGC